jgi:hypothetical protein
MAKLPTPVSVTDEYLQAILSKQQEILDELKKQKPESTLPAGVVELREPGKHKKRP